MRQSQSRMISGNAVATSLRRVAGHILVYIFSGNKGSPTITLLSSSRDMVIVTGYFHYFELDKSPNWSEWGGIAILHLGSYVKEGILTNH